MKKKNVELELYVENKTEKDRKAYLLDKLGGTFALDPKTPGTVLYDLYFGTGLWAPRHIELEETPWQQMAKKTPNRKAGLEIKAKYFSLRPWPKFLKQTDVLKYLNYKVYKLKAGKIGYFSRFSKANTETIHGLFYILDRRLWEKFFMVSKIEEECLKIKGKGDKKSQEKKENKARALNLIRLVTSYNKNNNVFLQAVEEEKEILIRLEQKLAQKMVGQNFSPIDIQLIDEIRQSMGKFVSQSGQVNVMDRLRNIYGDELDKFPEENLFIPHNEVFHEQSFTNNLGARVLGVFGELNGGGNQHYSTTNGTQDYSNFFRKNLQGEQLNSQIKQEMNSQIQSCSVSKKTFLEAEKHLGYSFNNNLQIVDLSGNICCSEQAISAELKEYFAQQIAEKNLRQIFSDALSKKKKVLKCKEYIDVLTKNPSIKDELDIAISNRSIQDIYDITGGIQLLNSQKMEKDKIIGCALVILEHFLKSGHLKSVIISGSKLILSKSEFMYLFKSSVYSYTSEQQNYLANVLFSQKKASGELFRACDKAAKPWYSESWFIVVKGPYMLHQQDLINSAWNHNASFYAANTDLTQLDIEEQNFRAKNSLEALNQANNWDEFLYALEYSNLNATDNPIYIQIQGEADNRSLKGDDDLGVSLLTKLQVEQAQAQISSTNQKKTNKAEWTQINAILLVALDELTQHFPLLNTDPGSYAKVEGALEALFALKINYTDVAQLVGQLIEKVAVPYISFAKFQLGATVDTILYVAALMLEYEQKNNLEALEKLFFVITLINGAKKTKNLPVPKEIYFQSFLGELTSFLLEIHGLFGGKSQNPTLKNLSKDFIKIASKSLKVFNLLTKDFRFYNTLLKNLLYKFITAATVFLDVPLSQLFINQQILCASPPPDTYIDIQKPRNAELKDGIQVIYTSLTYSSYTSLISVFESCLDAIGPVKWVVTDDITTYFPPVGNKLFADLNGIIADDPASFYTLYADAISNETQDNRSNDIKFSFPNPTDAYQQNLPEVTALISQIKDAIQ